METTGGRINIRSSPVPTMETTAKKKWPRSQFSREELKDIAARFPGFHYRIPDKEDTPANSEVGEICIFAEFFKVGFELPLPDFMVGFCNQSKLLPRIIMSNTVAILKGLFNFFEKWGVPWQLDNILSLLTFTEREGIFYAQPKHSSEFKVVELASSRHGWKDKYFFARLRSGEWPISTDVVYPLPHSLKESNITERVAELMKGFEGRPFCLHVDSLEVTAVKDTKKLKRKGQEVKAEAPKKMKAVEVASEEEPATGHSPRWSDIPPEATTVREKLPIRRPGVTPGEGTSKPRLEKVIDSTAPVSPKRVGDSDSGDSTPAAAGDAGEKEVSPGAMSAECIIDKKRNIMIFKANTKERYVPAFDPSKIPYNIAGMLLHPADKESMDETTTQELGERAAHLAQGSIILTKYICESERESQAELSRAKERASGMLKATLSFQEKWKKAKEELAASKEKAREVATSRQLEVAQLRRISEAEKAELQEEIARLKTSFDRANKEKAEANSHFIEEKALLERQLAVQKEISKSLKAGMEKFTSNTATATITEADKEKVIEDYKENEDFQYQMKDFGMYGFELLKRHLQKNQILPQATLDTLTYDKCVDEGSDEKSAS